MALVAVPLAVALIVAVFMTLAVCWRTGARRLEVVDNSWVDYLEVLTTSPLRNAA
jgi:hypothetical protein